MANRAVRDCMTCAIVGGGAPWANGSTNLANYRERCAYVRYKNAEMVGKCHYNEVAPPIPCETCQFGVGISLARPCTQNNGNVCTNNNFRNYVSRP